MSKQFCERIHGCATPVRPICEEIGYHLGQRLNATTQAAVSAIGALLRRFEQLEEVEANLDRSVELAEGSLQTG